MPGLKDKEAIDIKHCFELAGEALRMMRSCAAAGAGASTGEFYRARAKLREAWSHFQEALAVIQKLLGPLPAYATPEFKAMRLQTATEHRLTVKGMTLEELKDEVGADPLIQTVMSPNEVAEGLSRHFVIQRTGKRKLEHIKVRILLDKLKAYLAEADRLEKKALGR
jgi:hypothetical protein